MERTVCEEVFDESSQPSVEEIRDYATKIGIDPDTEPQLLPLAAEGLMRALPPGWRPVYDNKRQTYYYLNNLTSKTQWEHPLDEVYRDLVSKKRAESQSFSLGDPTEDATYNRDELLISYEEPAIDPVKNLEPISLGARRKEIKLSPIKANGAAIRGESGLGGNVSPKLSKQKSEDRPFSRKISLQMFSSFDDKKELNLENPAKEFALSGGGSMFLKSKKPQNGASPVENRSFVTSPEPTQPRSILRDRNNLESSKSLELDKSLGDKSEKDDDDKKSVRFNLDTTTDITFDFSEKSVSEEDKPNKPEDVINVKVTQSKSKTRFTVSPVEESALFEPKESELNNLKLVKPYPADFIKPTLKVTNSADNSDILHSSESDDDSVLKHLGSKANLSPGTEKPIKEKSRNSGLNQSQKNIFKNEIEHDIDALKTEMWEEKSEEIELYKKGLQKSHKQELERILQEEKSIYETNIKAELENLRIEMENRNFSALKQARDKWENELEHKKLDLEKQLKADEEHALKKLKDELEAGSRKLQEEYENKLLELEKELDIKHELNRTQQITDHNATLEQLKENHCVIIENLKREFSKEEQDLRKEHHETMVQFKKKGKPDADDTSPSKENNDERTYEKLRCEKRLLEDKYRCLKEKYLRLKTDVKLSIEKRNKKKELSGTTTTTTGSETEFSNPIKKERSPAHSPSVNRRHDDKYSSRHGRGDGNRSRPPEHKSTRQIIIQDLDTSASDRSYKNDEKYKSEYDSSDGNVHPGRCRKKLFSRLKSSSTSRLNNNSKSRKAQRSCSPVENLRRQLQKLEDLEDQFPDHAQTDTYHLRYPFTDNQKFEPGSSELEFFRHRIHLERDSIKRAKESLRSQKNAFQQRQKELKLKHGSMARHTLQQLCQEEKDLTDMEVSLHRTRSLLGEKVIRLRHLEQSLQRATLASDKIKQDDATLSDLSSHSASSGISSTEFATADGISTKNFIRNEHLQESSEIIQSLENLNSEIREIWEVLNKQQHAGNLTAVIPPLPLIYQDLGWPLLAGTTTVPAPPSIPTLADRLNNYRQQVALANAQSTVVTHANQGATTTLVERTRNLRHWLRQAGIDPSTDGNSPQATL